MRIDRLIHDAQAASPSFSAVPLDDDTRRQDWVETLAEDDVSYFVAERDGAPVGHLTLCPDPHDDEALHIASTAVVPEARGCGIGVALTTYALALAPSRGGRASGRTGA